MLAEKLQDLKEQQQQLGKEIHEVITEIEEQLKSLVNSQENHQLPLCNFEFWSEIGFFKPDYLTRESNCFVARSHNGKAAFIEMDRLTVLIDLLRSLNV